MNRIEAVRAPEPYELQYRSALDTDRNGVVSADELQRFSAARSRVGWVPLASMLAAERKLTAGSLELATTQQTLARSLVKARGSANQDDVNAVVAHLVQLPTSALMGIQRAGISIAVCRGGVTDYLKELKNQPVRGHSAADSWATVPGTSWNNEVVIATTESPRLDGVRVVPWSGYHHGSHSVLLHELGHAIVRHFGQFRGLTGSADSQDAFANPAFLTARAQDWDRLAPYYQQSGKGKGAGADETFAESFARFYGGDTTLEADWPALYRFWNATTHG
jgi:hypothetical protein